MFSLYTGKLISQKSQLFCIGYILNFMPSISQCVQPNNGYKRILYSLSLTVLCIRC